MSDAKRAGDGPAEVHLEAGKKYAWCACGHSATQPFCDGSHKHSGTGIKPRVFTAQTSGLAYLCRCKQTHTPPYCDGSHKKD